MLPLHLPCLSYCVQESSCQFLGDPLAPEDSQGPTHTSQSTARIREMSLTGRLTASRMMARVRTPPAGIPAAPTLDAVAVTLGERGKEVRWWDHGGGTSSHGTQHSQDGDDLHEVQGHPV